MPLRIYLTLILTVIGLAGLTIALLFSGPLPAYVGWAFLAAGASIALAYATGLPFTVFGLVALVLALLVRLRP